VTTPPILEELDRQSTPMGEVSLRRRIEPVLGVDVYEVQLGDEFLMSSLFTTAERALATLGLAELDGDDLDVVVGGLGLGYTACEVLADLRVRSLRVVEALHAVIAWHEHDLLPDAHGLVADDRCQLVHGDFFAMASEAKGFGPGPRRVHAVLVDIDHTPRHHLDPSHARFYSVEGLGRLARFIHPGGVFGLWSDDPPDDGFAEVLDSTFGGCDAHVVTFPNHYTGGESSNTVYVATV
jgi:spermidine synthase